jgi:hypothetical protein
MGFFEGFSRPPEADLEASQKRDSASDLGSPKACFRGASRAANGRPQETC